MPGNLKKLKNQINALEKHLNLTKKTLEALEIELDKSYDDVPGVEGVFDGIYMVSEEGKKFEVPPNYAAKSRLIYGMKLKMVDEEGKTLFKQIDKPEIEEVEGILSKKEGKWYILSHSGSYRISDTAANFNNVKANEEAIGVIPKGVYGVPFAALKKVIREPGSSNEKKDNKSKETKPDSSSKRSEPRTKPKGKPVSKEKKSTANKKTAPEQKKEEKKVDDSVKNTNRVLSDDDLR